MVSKEIFRGIIIPINWNENGDVVQIAIATYHEDRLLIADNKPGRELRSMLREPVIVEGIVRRQDKHPVVEVETYQIDKSEWPL